MCSSVLARMKNNHPVNLKKASSADFKNPESSLIGIAPARGLRKTILQFIVLFCIVGCIALFIAPHEHLLHLSVTIGGALLIGNAILMWIAFEQ